MRSPRRPVVVATLVVGVALATRTREASEPVSLWVADRHAGRVLGLDCDLFPRVALRAPWPVAVRETAGGLWLACAVDGRADGAYELRFHDRASLALVARFPAGEVRAIEAWDGDGVLALIGAERVVAWPSPRSVEVVTVLRGERLTALARCGALVAAGSEGGMVRLVELDPPGLAPLVTRDVPVGDAAILALERTGSPDGLFALDAAGRLFVLDPRAECAALVRNDLAGASVLAAAVDSRTAWVASDGDRWVRRFDAAGRLLAERIGIAQIAPVGGLASEDGGLVLATPGALLMFDPRAEGVPGQGGFEVLADVSSARPRPR